MPATVTKYVDDQQCSSSPARKCSPVTRQECQNVVEQVPKQSYKQECNTRLDIRCKIYKLFGF